MLTRGDDLLQQSIYYPLLMVAQRREGVALQTVVQGPGYESPNYGFVHTIDTSAILGKGVLHLFLTNRSLDENAVVEVDGYGFGLKTVQSAEMCTGPSPTAANTFEKPNLITNQPFNKIELRDGNAVVQLPPLSIAAISFDIEDC
jgi:alpha-N-arabinofuranosidase